MKASSYLLAAMAGRHAQSDAKMLKAATDTLRNFVMFLFLLAPRTSELFAQLFLHAQKNFVSACWVWT
jgi:hypothetical protein